MYGSGGMYGSSGMYGSGGMYGGGMYNRGMYGGGMYGNGGMYGGGMGMNGPYGQGPFDPNNPPPAPPTAWQTLLAGINGVMQFFGRLSFLVGGCCASSPGQFSHLKPLPRLMLVQSSGSAVNSCGITNLFCRWTRMRTLSTSSSLRSSSC